MTKVREVKSVTQIHFAEKVLRSTISIICFPLTFIQTVLSKYEMQKYKRLGEIINVGNHILHTIVTGKGKPTGPTVILESGMGGCALDWSLVQPELSKHTTVISYDRAGFGWSTQTIEQPTCQNYVNDLRNLLSRLELEPPYLLVGHSYGGMIMRLFASEYSDEVMGIILVDSTHEKRYLDSHLSENRRIERVKYHNRLRLGYLLSPIAVPRMLKQHIGSRRLPPNIQKKVIALGYRNNAYKAAYLEFLCSTKSADQLHKALPLKSDIPLIVLTAGRQGEEWKEAQKELLNLSEKTQQIIVVDSWHSIQIHNPQVVIDSVISLLK
jgi:pimeloyl-ACP methyl ester carboxylesterase